LAEHFHRDFGDPTGRYDYQSPADVH